MSSDGALCMADRDATEIGARLRLAATEALWAEVAAERAAGRHPDGARRAYALTRGYWRAWRRLLPGHEPTCRAAQAGPRLAAAESALWPARATLPRPANGPSTGRTLVLWQFRLWDGEDHSWLLRKPAPGAPGSSFNETAS